MNDTEGKSAFYRQISGHHTAEFQLGTIYVRSSPQVGFINPSLVVSSTPHYGGPSTPHYGAEQATTIKLSWWNVLANKRSSMPQALPQAMSQAMPRVMSWHISLDKMTWWWERFDDENDLTWINDEFKQRLKLFIWSYLI
jgi:hypothetical protein